AALVEVAVDAADLVDAAVPDGGPGVVQVLDRAVDVQRFAALGSIAMLVHEVDDELERLNTCGRVQYEGRAFLVEESGAEAHEPGQHVLGVTSRERDGVNVGSAVTVAVHGELFRRGEELVHSPGAVWQR